jgi:hypothetical protein
MKTITYFVLIALLVFSSCKNEKRFHLHDDADLILKESKQGKEIDPGCDLLCLFRLQPCLMVSRATIKIRHKL